MEQVVRKEAFTRGRLFFALCILAGNAIAWAIPGQVFKLVAREQVVLLGRYSRAQFWWLVLALLCSLLAILIRSAATPAARKRRAFALLASLMTLIPAAIGISLFVQWRTQYPYDPRDEVYHRPAHARYTEVYDDTPVCPRSYPRPMPGYGRVPCSLSYDAEGFRNAAALEACDLVALGDSFTEGSRVCDEAPWPVVLARESGLRVCNLGMSGYGAQEYLAALRKFGIPKKPKLVVCMLYEGNDFRSERTDVKHGITLGMIVATNPIIIGLDQLAIRWLSPIGAGGSASGLENLSWLPIAVPDGPSARYYAFAPKQVYDLLQSQAEFDNKSSWLVMTDALLDMRKLCEGIGAKLVIAYAPVKAHVILPLCADRLPPDKFRAFLMVQKKKTKPPEGPRLIQEVLQQLDNQEIVIRNWCESHGLGFVSLTRPLRDDAATGVQVYYSYDQHWSPKGHETAARAIREHLKSKG